MVDHAQFLVAIGPAAEPCFIIGRVFEQWKLRLVFAIPSMFGAMVLAAIPAMWLSLSFAWFVSPRAWGHAGIDFIVPFIITGLLLLLFTFVTFGRRLLASNEQDFLCLDDHGDTETRRGTERSQVNLDGGTDDLLGESLVLVLDCAGGGVFHLAPTGGPETAGAVAPFIYDRALYLTPPPCLRCANGIILRPERRAPESFGHAAPRPHSSPRSPPCAAFAASPRRSSSLP